MLPGGLFLGSNRDFVFTVDLQHPVRSVDCMNLTPDVSSEENWGQSCPLDEALVQDVPTQKQLAALGPGEPSHIGHVKLAMNPAGKGPEWPPKEFCLAYRDSTGWHADENVVTQTYNPSTDMLDVDLPVEKDGVDALYLFTESPAGAVPRITYTTE
jgi:hypothetical protein